MTEKGRQILMLAKAIQSTFSTSEWTEIGYITYTDEWIDSHPRLTLLPLPTFLQSHIFREFLNFIMSTPYFPITPCEQDRRSGRWAGSPGPAS